MKKNKENQKNVAEKASCADIHCPRHGQLSARGRIFEGYVTKKFLRRVVIEFEWTYYVRKYERYAKKKTRIHARLPSCMHDLINVGDYIKVRECRPLSKLIHFVVTEKIK
ncbi:MAG: 30S ribosomal protein S17 [archaeon]